MSAKRIAVVGAGLGGMAAAVALRQQGFEVDVYEQAGELGAFGAGINLSANAVKVLSALGLKPGLHEYGFEPVGIAWRNWADGSASRVVPLDHSLGRFGERYFIMHRGDLHRVLCEAFPAERIHLGKRAIGAESRDDYAAVQFADGTAIEADAVIAADGIHSAIRKTVFGGVGARYAGTMCWRSLIPAEQLPADIHDKYVNQWTGTSYDKFVISYYVRQGRYINTLAVMRQADWTSESWSHPSSREEMFAAFHDVGPKVRRVLENAQDVYKWGQFTGEPAADWVRGRLALLGDSAHAMLATWGQGACMAFEDSWVLAKWLAHHRDDLRTGLRQYEAIRKPRASKVQAMSRLEVRFKKQTSLKDRLYREWIYLRQFGATTPALYRWLYGYDAVRQWQQVV